MGKMRTSPWGKLFLLSIYLAFGAYGVAEAAERSSKEDLKGLPLLSSVEFYQMGDADLVMTISGKGLPQPDITYDGNRMTVVFREARWNNAERQRDISMIPMITSLHTEQSERDVVVELTTDRPVVLHSVRGTAPSDSYALRLTTAEQRQKTIEEPIVTKQPQTLNVPSGPFAINTPITLDLRDTELRDVFRMLGTYLKKNIIIDQSLPPALVTMTLKNVPLSEAFNYLMKTYDIHYEFVGKDTIVVGTVDGLSKIAGKEETRSYRVAYADPAAVQALLINMTKIAADRVVVDPRLRTLYVTSHPSKLEEIAIALQRLDHPGNQVMIHARILEFTDGVTKQVEAALNTVYDHWWFSYAQGTGQAGFIDDNRRGRQYDEPSTGGIMSNITDMVTPMQGTWREFDMAFRAMESINKGKTLANPSVITVDGMEASISLTEDYPYISGRDDAGNPEWSTETVGPQLKITPKVGRDGVISLALNVETGEVLDMVTGSTGEQMPRTSTRSVTTNVRVRNGEPFVIGGLFRENKIRERIRIPVLGQLPLLGELFTYRNNRQDKTEVVIVVVPYILSTPDVPIDQERVMLKQ